MNKNDKDLEVISVMGGRGSGKTTKVKKLLSMRKRKRIVIYDLKDEYDFKKLHGILEFAKYMKKNWYKSFKISYVPGARETPEHIKELSKLCYVFGEAQKSDYKNGKCQNITVVAEEMSVSAPNQKYPNGQGGFPYLVNIAREWGVEVMGISQRPAQANADFRGNSSKNFYFNLSDDLDIKAVQGKLGGQAEDLRSFPPHQYLELHRGLIKRCKNKLK